MTTVERIFAPRTHDLGDGFLVGRVLPYVERRMVGPFIFLDHMGPASMAAGRGLDVRPHPHIGLSTLTYLFEGEMFHRDSLGNAMEITPGAVNWMTAGSGIAHSERSSSEARKVARSMHGLQNWVALPKKDEETAPEFWHYDAATIPELLHDRARLRVIAGEAYGAQAPVKVYSPLFYVDVHLEAGATLALPNDFADQAVYVIDGTITVDATDVGPRTMVVFNRGARPEIRTKTPAHVVLLGGEPFDEPRHIWWNLVSSSKDRIEAAKADWKAGRFARIPGDDKEFIPLPD
ncbi:MAG TPA: pirin family protein [Rhizomicrobium sp.]|nr:pirin family protein [Rhizomicrobium sp.]